jgi:hypothetical protein
MKATTSYHWILAMPFKKINGVSLQFPKNYALDNPYPNDYPP